MTAPDQPLPWRDAARGGYPDARTLALPGIEIVRSLIAGRTPRPPISHLTGMAPTEVGDGSATFTMPATGALLSSHGEIALGALAILADGPLGCAIHSVLPPATGYATSEMSLRSLRAARPGPGLVARGTLVHADEQVAVSRARIADEHERPIVEAGSLCVVFPVAPPPDAGASEAQPRVEYDTPDPFERAVPGEILPPEVYARMSGLEILRAQIGGALPQPPLHGLTGMRIVDAAPGRAAVALPSSEWLCSPLRTVEGGAIAMLADAAITAAVQASAPTGQAVTVIDLKVNFLRPPRPDGRELLATAHVRHAGRMLTIADAAIVNADAKPVAIATGSAMAARAAGHSQE